MTTRRFPVSVSARRDRRQQRSRAGHGLGMFLLLLGGWLLLHQPQQALHGMIDWIAGARTFTHQESLRTRVAAVLDRPAAPPAAPAIADDDSGHRNVAAAPAHMTWHKLELFAASDRLIFPPRPKRGHARNQQLLGPAERPPDTPDPPPRRRRFC